MLSLTNGRETKNAPTLELCLSHANDMRRKFKPRGAGGMPTHRKKAVYTKKKIYTDASYAGIRAKNKKIWDEREKHVLEVLAKLKEPATSKELRKLIKLKPAPRSGTLRRLIKQKKIKCEGWSKGTRWSLV